MRSNISSAPLREPTLRRVYSHKFHPNHHQRLPKRLPTLSPLFGPAKCNLSQKTHPMAERFPGSISRIFWKPWRTDLFHSPASRRILQPSATCKVLGNGASFKRPLLGVKFASFQYTFERGLELSRSSVHIAMPSLTVNPCGDGRLAYAFETTRGFWSTSLRLADPGVRSPPRCCKQPSYPCSSLSLFSYSSAWRFWPAARLERPAPPPLSTLLFVESKPKSIIRCGLQLFRPAEDSARSVNHLGANSIHSRALQYTPREIPPRGHFDEPRHCKGG